MITYVITNPTTLAKVRVYMTSVIYGTLSFDLANHYFHLHDTFYTINIGFFYTINTHSQGLMVYFNSLIT
jgi:hypothetical protein